MWWGKLLCLALVAAVSQDAYGARRVVTGPALFEGEAGFSLLPNTLSAGHTKYGFHLSAMAWEEKPFTPWIMFDVGIRSFSTVNSGAVPSSTDPELSETKAASMPLLFRAYARLPLRTEMLGFRAFAGLTWIFFDFRNSTTAALPSAPTIGAIWTILLGLRWDLENSFAIGANPLASVAYFFLPEAALRTKIGSNYGVRLTGRLLYVRSIYDGGMTAFMPSMTLGFLVRF